MARCKKCSEEIDFLQIGQSEFLAVNVVDRVGYMERILTFESKWVFVTPHHLVCSQEGRKHKSDQQLTLF